MAINVRISNGTNTQKVSSSTIFLGATNVQNQVNTAITEANTALIQSNTALSTANSAYLEANNIISGSIPLTIVDAGTF